MPQLNGGDGDDLGANDELIAFKDEGDHEGKRNASAEGDLDDVKSSLVNESETNSSSDSEVSSSGRVSQLVSAVVALPSACISTTCAPLTRLCLRSCAGRPTPQARSGFGEQGRAQSAV